MRVDLHTHPLGHRYYYDRTCPHSLTPKDEQDIISLIAMGRERGLDVIAITDHDLALSGLWAAAYARTAGLSMAVLAGCECELFYLSEWIHILALNIKQPLVYTPYTPLAELIGQITAQGARSVLAHPMCYGREVYHELKTVVDGIEYRNGGQERRGAASFAGVLDADGYSGLRLHNSDYHYPDKRSDEQWLAATTLSADEYKHWFGC
jgi:predicted metal-dependent phosphoesterase TrpH